MWNYFQFLNKWFFLIDNLRYLARCHKKIISIQLLFSKELSQSPIPDSCLFKCYMLILFILYIKDLGNKREKNNDYHLFLQRTHEWTTVNVWPHIKKMFSGAYDHITIWLVNMLWFIDKTTILINIPSHVGIDYWYVCKNTW